jgi:hypothetical protein
MTWLGLGAVGIGCLAAGVVAVIIWRVIKAQARLRRTLSVVMLQVLLPKDLEVEEREEGIGQTIKERIAVAEQWLSTLANLPTKGWDRRLYGPPLLALEIVAREDGVIAFYAGCERRYLGHLERQIYAHYPEAEVRVAEDFTIFEYGDAIQVGRLRLARAHFLPVASYKELEVDPMQALTGALANIQNKDAAVIQYILEPASKKIRQRGRRAAKRTIAGKQWDVGTGGSVAGVTGGFLTGREEIDRREQQAQNLTPRAQQRVELVEEKGAQPQFSVTIRLAVAARRPEEAERVFAGLVGAFAQYDLPDLNSFKLTVPRGKNNFLRDLIFRLPREGANILSTTELASLFHFPLPTTGTPNMAWRGAKVAPLPAEVVAVRPAAAAVLLGKNVYRGQEKPVYLLEDDRRRHVYLIGQTGTGKTTLFLNMIVQDIQAGRGVGVIDPHGDLIEDIMLHVPAERQGDVIVFDPRDTERPLGFNILEVSDSAQQDMVVNEVVQILQKLAARLNPESVGPMFEHYLRNALLALTQAPGSTLVDVPRMFVDEAFRAQILARNTNPAVTQFWEREFKQSQRGQMSADMLSYVISKLGRFIGNQTVRNLIGQAKSSFDVRRVMDEGKILLCNLSKGNLGDINSDLLGFVLVSKIQIAALGRADQPESTRRDFYLYLDEFQNFTTDSIGIILSEARKYKLNLNLTHQFTAQLDESVREAVFGNVGTIISYRIGTEDAELMAGQMKPVFREYDLLNLERFSACVRLLNNGSPLRPFSLRVLPPPPHGSAKVREEIREESRRKYGRARARVEEEILERFRLGAEGVSSSKSAGEDYLSESLLDIS